MVNRFILTLFLIGLFLGKPVWAKEPIPNQTKMIYLQPLGSGIKEPDIHIVKTALEQTYGFTVKTLSPIALPKSAYYPRRSRYRAEKLIDFLRGQLPETGDYMLGLTAVDISTTSGSFPDWGVLGLAGDIGNDEKAAVFSIYRCKKQGASMELARQRLAKTAVHELGHVLGLSHCKNPGCLMEDAQGKVVTTDRESDLCEQCRNKLHDLGFVLPQKPQLPWPLVSPKIVP